MIYTIIGGFIGYVIAYYLTKIFNVNFRSSTFLPSNGEILVMLGTFVGSCVGFGFGASRLLQGNYFPF